MRRRRAIGLSTGPFALDCVITSVKRSPAHAMKTASRKPAKRPAAKARAAGHVSATPIGAILRPQTGEGTFPIVGIGASAGGLEAALREECVAFSEQVGIPAQFESRRVSVPLQEDVSLCLYRVAQESLRNIARHAQAAYSSPISSLPTLRCLCSTVSMPPGKSARPTPA